MRRPVSTIVWLRRNFRVEGNLSLKAATDRGDPVIPVFILEEKPLMGSAARWWLAHSLRDLQKSLRNRGSRLILRKGDPQKVLESLIKETGARFFGTRAMNRRRERSMKRSGSCSVPGGFFVKRSMTLCFLTPRGSSTSRELLLKFLLLSGIIVFPWKIRRCP